MFMKEFPLLKISKLITNQFYFRKLMTNNFTFITTYSLIIFRYLEFDVVVFVKQLGV